MAEVNTINIKRGERVPGSPWLRVTFVSTSQGPLGNLKKRKPREQGSSLFLLAL
jgi:hypothetical protein